MNVLQDYTIVDVGAISVKSVADFYKAVGWDGQSNINTAKVVVNPLYAEYLMIEYICNDGNGMEWLLNSPNQDSHVPYGKVLLLNGWCI
jgi:hypothetical protein